MAYGHSEKSDSKTYVGLVSFTLADSWYEMEDERRTALSAEHAKRLSEFSDRVRLTHMAGTGLSKYDLIIHLESEDLVAMNEMIDTFKASAKARLGVLHEISVMEKGLGRLGAK